jgi:hypothetical protein
MTTPAEIAAQTSLLSVVLQRCHAIHEENKTIYTGFDLECHRFFPRDLSSIALPAIVPIPGQGQHNNIAYGSDILHSITTLELILFVDNFTAGSGPKWAQLNAELAIEHLIGVYWNRPRLETASSGPLADILEDARLTQNSPLEVSHDTIATVRFTLLIELTRDIDRL